MSLFTTRLALFPLLAGLAFAGDPTPSAAPKQADLDNAKLALQIVTQQRNQLAIELQDAKAQIQYLSSQLKQAQAELAPTPTPTPTKKNNP